MHRQKRKRNLDLINNVLVVRLDDLLIGLWGEGAVFDIKLSDFAWHVADVCFRRKVLLTTLVGLVSVILAGRGRNVDDN